MDDLLKAKGANINSDALFALIQEDRTNTNTADGENPAVERVNSIGEHLLHTAVKSMTPPAAMRMVVDSYLPACGKADRYGERHTIPCHTRTCA